MKRDPKTSFLRFCSFFTVEINIFEDAPMSTGKKHRQIKSDVEVKKKEVEKKKCEEKMKRRKVREERKKHSLIPLQSDEGKQ